MMPKFINTLVEKDREKKRLELVPQASKWLSALSWPSPSYISAYRSQCKVRLMVVNPSGLILLIPAPVPCLVLDPFVYHTMLIKRWSKWEVLCLFNQIQTFAIFLARICNRLWTELTFAARYFYFLLSV